MHLSPVCMTKARATDVLPAFHSLASEDLRWKLLEIQMNGPADVVAFLLSLQFPCNPLCGDKQKFPAKFFRSIEEKTFLLWKEVSKMFKALRKNSAAAESSCGLQIGAARSETPIVSSSSADVERYWMLGYCILCR